VKVAGLFTGDFVSDILTAGCCVGFVGAQELISFLAGEKLFSDNQNLLFMM